MNLKSLLSISCATLALAGCHYDKGPYLPEVSKTPAWENSERVVLLDPTVQESVTCSVVQEQRLADNRLEVTAQIRNRENKRIEVQVNCVFKNQSGFSSGDETPFQNLILTENATEQVKFTSANADAWRYTVRVRWAR